MKRDDRNDPFDEFFDELERMMNDVMSGELETHIEHKDSKTNQSRDIHVDIYEDEGTLRVVADLPGVSKDDIELTCDGERLTIDATGSQREYHERIDLPKSVEEHTAEASYNNGILEVSFETGDNTANIDLS